MNPQKIPNKIGILAYGSLVDDSGEEIRDVEDWRIENIKTPFEVEFAHFSVTRGGAPTLTRVTKGGAKVKAKVLVLDSVSKEEALSEARDIIYRRETGKVGARYHPPPPGFEGNRVIVDELSEEELSELDCGIETILYARTTENKDPLTPERLAEQAIMSARSRAGRDGKDGISYLIAAKRSGVQTPLMREYEQQILRQTDSSTLEDALKSVLSQVEC